MTLVFIAVVAFAASILTFFSGFGLGTLLLPAFLIFFAPAHAIILTAVVHFLNGLFKVALVGRHADRNAVLWFGVPAIATAVLGAWTLIAVAEQPVLGTYTVFGFSLALKPVNMMVGVLLLAITAITWMPNMRALALHPRYLPVGGLISGFIGGLTGLQGALRSAFLSRADLTPRAFVATGAVVSVLIDIARLSTYSLVLMGELARSNTDLLVAATLSAFAGVIVGNWRLATVRMPAIQKLVTVMVTLVAIALIAGAL